MLYMMSVFARSARVAARAMPAAVFSDPGIRPRAGRKAEAATTKPAKLRVTARALNSHSHEHPLLKSAPLSATRTCMLF
jgi:hypothetical protein